MRLETGLSTFLSKQKPFLLRKNHLKEAILEKVIKHPLLYTLSLSLVFHAILFSLFHITVWLPFEPQTHMYTPSIAIDADSFSSLNGSSVSFHQKIQEDLYGDLLHVAYSSHGNVTGSEFYAIHDIPALSGILEENDSTDRTLLLPPIVPWIEKRETIPSLTPIRTYPIKLTLYYGIKELEMISDASEFFTPATEASIAVTSQFCHTKPTVEFFVTVDEETGKISSLSCVKELVDKRLQSLAIKILKSLRFRLHEYHQKRLLSGMISLQFNGIFETIRPYVVWDYLKTHTP